MNRREAITALLGAGLIPAGMGLAKTVPAPEPVQKEPTLRWGEMVLHPKKIICMMKVPEELTTTYHLHVEATVAN